MALDKYIVSRSNYTIKKKHKTVSNGTIYERDFMTTTQNGSFDGDVFPYSCQNAILNNGDAHRQYNHMQ